MSILEYLKTALVALRLNKLRSVLTTLGIIIGVASVIVMSGIGSGASKQIENQISSLGTNQLTIFPGSANVGGRRGGFVAGHSIDDSFTLGPTWLMNARLSAAVTSSGL